MNKKSFCIFLSVFVFFTVFLTGCGKEDPKTEDTVVEELVVTPTTLTPAFAQAGETKSFNITSNTNWTVTTNNDWLTVSPTSGTDNGSINVTATANDAAATRNGTVTVTTAGGINRTVSLEQAGTGPFLILAQYEEDVPAEGGEFTVTVSASGAWTVNIPSTVDWITLDEDESDATQATFIVEPTPLHAERTAEIIFMLTGTSTQRTFTVTQEAGVPPESIELAPTTGSVASIGGDVTVTVTASDTWTVEINPADTWVTLFSETPTQAVLRVASHSGTQARTAEITFRVDANTEATFTLTQAAFQVGDVALDSREIELATLFGNGLIIVWDDPTVGEFIEITYTGTGGQTETKTIEGDDGRVYLMMKDGDIPTTFPIASFSYKTAYSLADLYAAGDIDQQTYDFWFAQDEEYLYSPSVSRTPTMNRTIVSSSSTEANRDLIYLRNFDLGGNGVAFVSNNDPDAPGASNFTTYRADQGDLISGRTVKIEPAGVTSIAGAILSTVEWHTYTVYVENAGVYYFDIHGAASANASRVRHLSIVVNNNETPAPPVHNFLGGKGWWSETNAIWFFVESELSLPELTLNAGFNTIRLNHTTSDTWASTNYMYFALYFKN